MSFSQEKSPTHAASKKKTLTIRIDPETLSIMDLFKEKSGIGKSELVRGAIHTYLLMNWMNEDHPHPKLIFAWNMFRPLLDLADDDTIEEIAQISFINGRANQDVYKNYQDNFLKEKIDNDGPEFWMNLLLHWVFKKNAQNWFMEASWVKEGDFYLFTGEHQLGANFSKFISRLMDKYLENTQYHVISLESKVLETRTIENHSLKEMQSLDLMKLKIGRKK
ncbi:MAG: CopG family transcriptional regulator [Promethearchaeota archaeon]